MSTIKDGTQYIKQCRDLGFNDAEIISAMKKANWQEADIHAALIAAPKPKAARHASKIILYIIIGVVILTLLAVAGLIIYTRFTN